MFSESHGQHPGSTLPALTGLLHTSPGFCSVGQCPLVWLGTLGFSPWFLPLVSLWPMNKESMVCVGVGPEVQPFSVGLHPPWGNPCVEETGDFSSRDPPCKPALAALALPLLLNWFAPSCCGFAPAVSLAVPA